MVRQLSAKTYCCWFKNNATAKTPLKSDEAKLVEQQ